MPKVWVAFASIHVNYVIVILCEIFIVLKIKVLFKLNLSWNLLFLLKRWLLSSNVDILLFSKNSMEFHFLKAVYCKYDGDLLPCQVWSILVKAFPSQSLEIKIFANRLTDKWTFKPKFWKHLMVVYLQTSRHMYNKMAAYQALYTEVL